MSVRLKVRHYVLIIVGIVLLAVIGTGGCLYHQAYDHYTGNSDVTVIVPEGATDAQLKAILVERLDDYGAEVYRMWSLRNGDIGKAPGLYIVSPGDRAWSVASRIMAGQSATVNVTFNSVRTFDELADKVAGYFPWSADEFKAACSRLLPERGYTRETFPAAFIPDTYQFYGDATPDEVVSKLADQTDRFWNSTRRAKAGALELTPAQVVTLASIVEEESNNWDERPAIARLYMNRLAKGMKLEADPTVKFAIGDFTLRRITSKHTAVESPYNTYRVTGLPPGPIRVPDARTIDCVLDAPANDYLFMCAKEDMSGTHNFAADYATHQANARRYHQALDERGIK